jgi:hypothetical protein
MKCSQYEVIGNLIKRKRGATVAELVWATCSSSPHRRMFEMRRKGWHIWREEIPGKQHGRYFGKAPQA